MHTTWLWGSGRVIRLLRFCQHSTAETLVSHCTACEASCRYSFLAPLASSIHSSVLCARFLLLRTQAILHSKSKVEDSQRAALKEIIDTCAAALLTLRNQSFKRQLATCRPTWLSSVQGTAAGRRSASSDGLVVTDHLERWNVFVHQLQGTVLELSLIHI